MLQIALFIIAQNKEGNKPNLTDHFILIILSPELFFFIHCHASSSDFLASRINWHAFLRSPASDESDNLAPMFSQLPNNSRIWQILFSVRLTFLCNQNDLPGDGLRYSGSWLVYVLKNSSSNSFLVPVTSRCNCIIYHPLFRFLTFLRKLAFRKFVICENQYQTVSHVKTILPL